MLVSGKYFRQHFFEWNIFLHSFTFSLRCEDNIKKQKINSQCLFFLSVQAVLTLYGTMLTETLAYLNYVLDLPSSPFKVRVACLYKFLNEMSCLKSNFSVFRLLDQLPRANVVLLRYLFGVLHNIEQHSSSNQMTAFNLAVCVAPSILWPPTSSRPELENEFTKKVMKFFIFMPWETESPFWNWNLGYSKRWFLK